MKHFLITTDPVALVTQQVGGSPPTRFIAEGQTVVPPEGHAYVPDLPRPSYDANTQRVVQDQLTLDGYGWTVVDLTDEELEARIASLASQHKATKAALARQRAEAEKLAEIDTEAAAMDDATALENPDLFDPYEIGVSYQTDDRFVDPATGFLYKVLQAHTSALEWKPSEASSLYVRVQTSTEWAPDTAYAADDEVTYQGTAYRCLSAHTSQVGWEPPNVPSLWTAI